MGAARKDPKDAQDGASRGPGAESTPDRMMRFGRALFAVPKDELPKRDEPAEREPRKKPKPATDA